MTTTVEAVSAQVTTSQIVRSAAGAAANVTSKGGGTTSLFRAVSQAELDDIAVNGLRTLPSLGYETGKLFATSLDDAARFGRNNFAFDKIPNHLIRVDVPKNIMQGAYQFTADGMRAVSIPSNQLGGLRGIYSFKYSPLIK